MPLPNPIKTALDTLWDELQASDEKEFAFVRTVVGSRTYKIRLFKYPSNNQELSFKIEVIRKG